MLTPTSPNSATASSVMPKGHILFVNRVFPPDSGASGLRLLELCQGLAEKNWQISVLTNKGRGGEPGNLHPLISVIRLNSGGLGKPKWWQYPFLLMEYLYRALTVPRPDIIVTLTDPYMAAMISAQVKSFRKIRAVHWVHDLFPDLFPLMGVKMPGFQSLLMLLSRVALNAHDRVVALGDDMKAVLVKDGVKAEKIAIIPNWPDVTSTLMDKRKPNREESQNLFVIENTFTVLYSGNFAPVHDFDALLDAIKIVQNTPHAIRFIFAGDGPRFNDVRDKVEAMMLTNTHFVRAQPKEKFIDMLLAGDLHVAAMVAESVGLIAPSKINSALGLARPCLVVGSPKSFQAELLRKYDAGRVIDPNDPQAKFKLADAIIHYATNPEAYAQAKENALKAAESISFDKGLAQFDALFSDLLKM